MRLLWLIIVPALGGLFAWAMGRRYAAWSRGPAILALLADLAIVLSLPASRSGHLRFSQGSNWMDQFNIHWIPQLGVRFHLAMDGLSFWLVLLTVFLGLLTVVAPRRQAEDHAGAFNLSLMLVLAGVIGVFLAVDLFLFYFFWEVMLVPMYFLIVVWGDGNRRYAGTKFFLFTQLSGLLMLLAILGLYFVHGQTTGEYTFDYAKLLHTRLTPTAELWLFLGFFGAFLVKLPAVPLHSWLPEAYTSAPTAGSVLLAGLLSKTGAYGLLRFAIPLFPHAAQRVTEAAMILAVIGILYGALLAFAQTDLKRLIAYSSISHLGFVLLGIFAWSRLALQGVVLQMLCHGLATGGLFLLAGTIEERLHTRDMRTMGGLWTVAPRMGATAMFFALAAVGLPGLGNFVGEFLILLGSFKANVALTAAATAGLVGAVIYALWMMQLIFHGPLTRGLSLPDLKFRELSVLGILAMTLLWLGLYPQPVFNTVKAAINGLQEVAHPGSLPVSMTHEVQVGGSGIDPAILQPDRGGICVARPPHRPTSSVGAAWVWPSAARRLNPALSRQSGALAGRASKMPLLRSWPRVFGLRLLQRCRSYGANPARPLTIHNDVIARGSQTGGPLPHHSNTPPLHHSESQNILHHPA
jgi:NADH-quinone oxidoreductase subunit M